MFRESELNVSSHQRYCCVRLRVRLYRRHCHTCREPSSSRDRQEIIVRELTSSIFQDTLPSGLHLNAGRRGGGGGAQDESRRASLPFVLGFSVHPRLPASFSSVIFPPLLIFGEHGRNFDPRCPCDEAPFLPRAVEWFFTVGACSRARHHTSGLVVKAYREVDMYTSQKLALCCHPPRASKALSSSECYRTPQADTSGRKFQLESQ